jgi:ATP-dependent exoDNAse (exonuclease V) beta subunit
MMTRTTKSLSKPGIYKGIPFDEYDQINAVNGSLLEYFQAPKGCPAKAREYMLNRPESTKAQDFGTLCHTALFEPEKINTEYSIAPVCDKRTKEGKELWNKHLENSKGKIVVDADQMKQAHAIADSAMSLEIMQKAMSSPRMAEVVVVWREDNGVMCKARLDLVANIDGFTYVIDLKTTGKTADAYSFSKVINDYGYHRKAAFYLRGLNKIAPTDRKFVFVAMEKKPPYCCSAFDLDNLSLDIGLQESLANLERYKWCSERNVWPSYKKGLQTISLPNWALKNAPTDEEFSFVNHGLQEEVNVGE